VKNSLIYSFFLKPVFLDLKQHFKMSFLPPLLIYLAAGVSSITGIVGIFFIKDYLNISAAFLAGLGFWAGIPWALKMPLGHMVDLIWNKKNILIYIGAALISISLLIMYFLISNTDLMVQYMSAEKWFVLSVILSPIGYVLQDVVADAMTVEAVPEVDRNKRKYSDKEIKAMHTTMQTFGRFSIIGGTVLVAAANIYFFRDASTLEEQQKIAVYSNIYLYALAIPLISISGIFLSKFIFKTKLKFSLIKPDYTIIFGSLIFVIFVVTVGLLNHPMSQEIVFFGSLIIVIYLMKNLLKKISPTIKNTIIGTAIIVFMFRAVPGVGAGMGWFEIDILGFDQQFFSLLSLISSLLTMTGIIIFRKFMYENTISKIIIYLSFLNAILLLPSLAMYYGFHEWTSDITNEVVDAKFIALINTALESPLGQVAMIPMLAWIAKNAPSNLKATFFAVFASFTNLALSASNLFTKYLNQIFTVTREVKDKINQNILINSNYDELGMLIFVVILITFFLPYISILVIQRTSLQTNE
jgi:MFS family permease